MDVSKEDIKDMRRRLKAAYGKVWLELPAEKQEKVLERFYVLSKPTHLRPRAMFRVLQDRFLNFALFFLAAGIAILIGLLVNIIHDAAKSWAVIYPLGVSILLAVFIWGVNRLFEESANNFYRDNRFLEKILKDLK